LNIPKDKLGHFIAGLLIGLLSFIDPSIALIAGIIIGAIKEAVDYATYGDWDFLDFCSTVAGTAIVVAIFLGKGI
jgi:hypothetical protein